MAKQFASKAKPSTPKVGEKRQKPTAPKKEERKAGPQNNEYLVDEFAQRWNYALPKYPPENFDYSPSLKSLKLKLVSQKDFQKLKNDHSGAQSETLVYQIDYYQGMFRDANGKIYDLRPKTDFSKNIIRPSLKTFQ